MVGCRFKLRGALLPKLLRRVAVLTATSAIGISLLTPLAVESARQPAATSPISLLDAAPATSTVDRGVPGRERLALFSLIDLRHRVAAETLAAPRTLPTPASADMQATIVVAEAGTAAVPLPTPVPLPLPTPIPLPTPVSPPPPPVGSTVSGLATWYCCTQGWRGEPVVALPGALGGQYDPPPAARSVTVCADRCATLPVVDYCDCYWGTANQKVADLSPEAWALVSDVSTDAGVIEVTVHLD